MPIRAALNIAYALLMEGLDSKQRAEMDSLIYGWGEMSDRGNRVLAMPAIDESGGES